MLAEKEATIEELSTTKSNLEQDLTNQREELAVMTDTYEKEKNDLLLSHEEEVKHLKGKFNAVLKLGPTIH
jgi:uncharacterized coiled-coil protein SlyX